MSKTAEEVGLIAGGVALAALTYGGASSVFVSELSPAWASAANASSLFAIGVSAGLAGTFGLLQSILNPIDTSVPGAQQTLSNSAAWRRVIYGFHEVGAVLTFDEAPAGNGETGQNQGAFRNFRHQVYTVASHKISSFGRNGVPMVVIDGINTELMLDPGGSGYYVPSDSLNPYGGSTGGNAYGGQYAHIGFEFDLGDPTNSLPALPLLAQACPDWVASCRQQGRAKVHVAMRFDWNADGSQIGVNNGNSSEQPEFNGSDSYSPGDLVTSVPIYVQGRVPQFRFPLTGVPVVDTRVPSGGGYAVAANPSNPALCTYDYLTNTDYGMSVNPATIPIDEVNAAANICEEQAVVNIAANGGSVSENLYACNGLFDHSTPRGDVLKGLVASMAGIIVPPGDSWHLFAGAYNPPSFSLSDSDLRDSIKADVRISRRDICNTVGGTFIPQFLPTNTTQALPGTWRPTDFPTYQANGLNSTPNYLAEDGGQPIRKDIRLAFTTSIWMAQRLAKIVMMLLRFQWTLHLACKLTAFPIQAGDTITFIHERWAGLSPPPPTTFFVTQATLIVDARGGAPALGVDLVLRETDPAIYQFTAPSSPSNQGEYSRYGSLGTI